MANGFLFYRGPSAIDNEPIIAIATFGSKNAKTGSGLIQTWIMREDIGPVDAQKNGSDRSVCGSCPLRPIIMHSAKAWRIAEPRARQCYVKTFQAPRSVWSAYHRGVYPALEAFRNLHKLAGMRIRLGSYGNPSAIPFEAWADLARVTGARIGTGYDHMWRIGDSRFSRILMASVHSEDEAREAQSLGYRTFRVRKSTDPIMENEIICPASKEAGKRLTCDKCFACNGNPGGKDTLRARSIVIMEH